MIRLLRLIVRFENKLMTKQRPFGLEYQDLTKKCKLKIRISNEQKKKLKQEVCDLL